MTNNGVIDRQSPVPYYQQLVDVLKKRIESGEIEIGARLPSEAELGNEFGLARATIRQALQELEARGLVHRIARRGVFASEPRSDTGWIIQGPEGFLENALTHQNRSVSTRVLRYGTIELPAHASRSLEVPPGSRGFELVRVRSVDGVPAVFSTNYCPEQLVPVVSEADEVLSGNASYTELLARAGYALGGAHRIIHALAPSAEVADALEIPLDTPVLRIRSVAWTSLGVRYDLYETWVHSEVIPLEVNVSTVDLTAHS